MSRSGCIWVAAFVSSVATCGAAAQVVSDRECAQLVRTALDLHHADVPLGHALTVRHEARTTLWSSPLDTAHQLVETFASSTMKAIKSAGVEVWTDATHTVRLDVAAKVLHVGENDRIRKAVAAQRRLSQMLPEAIVAHSRVLSCERIDNVLKVTLAMDSAYHRFFNATHVELRIGSDHVIQRLRISHPPSSLLASTEYRLLHRELSQTADSAATTVQQRFFENDGRLRPMFSQYRIAGARN